jgi:hypothetical protein
LQVRAKLPTAARMVQRQIGERARGSFVVTIDFDNSFGKGLRGFLRQIVTDALDDAVRAFARELPGIRGAVRGRRNAIGITIQGNRGHCDDRTCGKSLFEIVVLWVSFCQAQPPAVIMDHDADVVRVVEGRCGAIERGLIEVPFRGIGLPDEFGQIASVCVQTSLSWLQSDLLLPDSGGDMLRGARAPPVFSAGMNKKLTTYSYLTCLGSLKPNPVPVKIKSLFYSKMLYA